MFISKKNCTGQLAIRVKINSHTYHLGRFLFKYIIPAITAPTMMNVKKIATKTAPLS
jgi:hypothetical protein